MSFLVELPRSAYPDHAFDELTVTSAFDLANARALMWLSQLAYETAHKAKVKQVLAAWGLSLEAALSNDPVTGLPPRSACMIAASGHGATFIAFSGTDPLKIEDWITNFTAVPSANGLHTGFENAIATVWPLLKLVMSDGDKADQRLIFAGHSLGGALAMVAAERVLRELGMASTAVYTFGSPRVGGAAFFDNYTPGLGERTFRLINGTDIVPTVPPSRAGGFRHVGRALQCASGARFDADGQLMAALDNKPEFISSFLQSSLADLRAVSAFRLIRDIGPRPLDRLTALLPRMVRDHVPASYFRALATSV